MEILIIVSLTTALLWLAFGDKRDCRECRNLCLRVVYVK